MDTRVLAEIRSESLIQLLSAVKYETAPPGSTLIPALDAHFFSAPFHHASPYSSLNRGDVIEIQGLPGSGKTHLLYFLLATCLLPSSHLFAPLGGWERVAYVLDMDQAFDIRRFKQLLSNRLTRLIPAHAVPLVAAKCLDRLHIFRPTSSNQLAATIAHLPKYHATHFRELDLGLIALDSVSTFCWRDRLTVEQLRSGPPLHDPRLNPNPLHHILSKLQEIRLSHGAITVMTNWGLVAQNKPLTGFFNQHLNPYPSPFVGSTKDFELFPLTHHITLSAEHPPVQIRLANLHFTSRRTRFLCRNRRGRELVLKQLP